MLLDNRIGIVSGVGPGIGRSIALAFAREGADLALAARSEAELHAVATEVESLGRRAICVPTDITHPEQCDRLAAATYEAFGRIDLLVNNAFTSNPVVRFAESSLDEWRPAMEVNLWGSLNMTKAVVPYMREVGEGRVIMTSVSDHHIDEGYGPYVTSKAALQTACRVLAGELGRWGIRVNTVAAGATEGATMDRYIAEQAARRGVDARVLHDAMAADNALGYLPSADEVASAVLFFASSMGNAATGQFLVINGGRDLG